MLESYFSFSDKHNVDSLLRLKIPSEAIMEIIKIKKERLFQKIPNLNSEIKIKIEQTVDGILATNTQVGVDEIKRISEILYFINIAFIKMMAPDYKDVLMSY
ncbi:hypothetical protein LCGC14_1093850 [marine sediment metagenome]|uniref:Uncharacterized protein n=1 Tax=marine sediment metagenome TaxID=412755 RepID=A0A0F9QHM8_9ZZZZ